MILNFEIGWAWYIHIIMTVAHFMTCSKKENEQKKLKKKSKGIEVGT